MNKAEQDILDRGLIFKGIRGSQAYGTNIKGSDTDYVGIYVQDESDILGLRYIPQISSENNDDVYYEIRRFLELAMNGNPNILEVFNLPEDCVVFSTPAFEYVQSHLDRFLTKNLYNTFSGYANTQIKKAKGLNKKMNWDESKMTRKGVLDFCYVLGGKEESKRFVDWESTDRHVMDAPEEFGKITSINRKSIGLAKVNNFPDIYSMYFIGEHGGIEGKDSNDVQLRSIPKNAMFLGYLGFDKNAYSTHCKDYREYKQWVENRNELRHNTNLEHGQNYDSKNMMHCLRLIGMAIDIAQGKGVVVRREDKDFLIDVRLGKFQYKPLLEVATQNSEYAKKLFEESGLPETVPEPMVHSLINEVRRMHNGIQAV